MSWPDFWTETYPALWHRAYQAGVHTRRLGLPRKCNLTERQYITPGGHILKVYRSAWEQGWDGFRIPAEFSQVENCLADLPLRPMEEGDLCG